MSNELDLLFQGIDDAIASNVSHKIIDRLFIDSLRYIQDTLEIEAESIYNTAKHRYHSKKSCYLNMIGQEEASKKEELLSLRYGSKLECKPTSSRNAIDLNTTATTTTPDISQPHNVQLDDLKQSIQKCFDKFKNILGCNLKTITRLEELLQIYSRNEIRSFKECVDLHGKSAEIRLMLDVLKTQRMSDDNKTQEQDLGQISSDFQFSALLETFYTSVGLCEYEFRRIFCQFLLCHKSTIRDLIFSDVPFTEERITSQYRKFALLFYPDKVNEIDKSDFRNIFECVFQCKEELIKGLRNKGDVCQRIGQYMEVGQNLWETARDYSRARNGDWTKLVHFKAEELKNRSDEILKESQKTSALLAYEQYRAAALLLNASSSALESSELRRLMARSLYTAELYLQAQIYTVAAMYILVRETGSGSSKKLDELQQFLEEIRNRQKQTAPSAPEVSTATATDAEPQVAISSSALSVNVKHEVVPMNLDQSSQVVLMSTIKHELRSLVLQRCLIRSVEKPVNTSQELILSAKRKAALYRADAARLAITSVGSGIIIVQSAFEAMASGAAIGSALGPVGAGIGGFLGFSVAVGGLLLSKRLWEKSQNQFQEPTKRENLNHKFESALEHCKNQNYAAFLEELATEYWTDCRLIRIEQDESAKKIKISINPTEIIKTLLEHEFRPDGIAYLLNLIGEASLNSPILLQGTSFRQPRQSRYNELAVSCFEEIFSESKSSLLLNRARQLDEQVRKKSLLTDEQLAYHQQLWRSVTSRWSAYVYSIPKEYFQDALLTPFTTRFKELGDIARLNYAIAHVIIGGRDNFEECQHAVFEIKTRLAATSHNQFFMVSETMIQALDDLLLAVGIMPKALTDQHMLALEYEIAIENITVVMIGNVPVCCEAVKTVNYAVHQLAALCDLSNESLNTSQLDFAQKVKEMYESKSDDSDFKLMMEIDESDNILNWFNEHYCKQQWTFTVAHLPILKRVYGVKIQSCYVAVNSTYGQVFVLNETLDDDTAASLNSRLFVVLDDRRHKIIAMFRICNQRISFLYNQLHLARTDQLKIDLHYQIAKSYQLEAEDCEKVHHLKAVAKWNEAKNCYLQILQIEPKNLLASVGYARCLIMLSKWTLAKSFLCETILQHENSAEAWCLLGIARRKLRSYYKATSAFNKAIEIEPSHAAARREKNILTSLSNETREQRWKLYNRMTTSCNKIREQSSSTYNILSIDGGGIRGIMPAVCLTEIERLTNCSTTSLFNLMAGTSTGAIVAAGLSASNRDRPTVPRYRAADLVKLYMTRANDVFEKPRNHWYNFRRNLTQEAKYISESRQKVFKYYFDHTKLSQVLTELVIPAVKNDSQVTHLFNRYDCRQERATDYELHDILMCTTAAPTYFNPHKLGRSQYVDGGVQMNNPVMAAYDQAIHYDPSNKEKLFVLSLGTGDYVPDPLHPNANRHLLFYGMHSEELLNIIFDAPQYNVDIHMLSVLNRERYQRWQVWLEDPIGLDDTDEVNIDLLFDKAREFMEERLALDDSNRLGLVLDRLKGDPH